MSFKTIEVEYGPPGAIIRLNRPDKRNALSIELRYEMVDCLARMGSGLADKAEGKEKSCQSMNTNVSRVGR